jgi:ketosteroid isomerase-like protein
VLVTSVTVSAGASADAVQAAATAWTEAVLKRDQRSLELLLPDALQFAYADGKSVQVKRDYIASIVGGTPRYESFAFTEAPLVFAHDNTAVVSAYVHAKEPGRQPARLRVMQLYVQNGGRWQLAASACTAVRAPGASTPPELSIPAASASAAEYTTDEGVVKSVKEAASGWTGAAVRKDKAALEGYLAHDLIFVHSNGSTMQNKAEYLAASARNTYEALPMSDVKIQSFGKTALLTAYIDTKNAGREPFRVRTFQVFVESDGKWRLAAFQSTRVAAGPGQR